MDHYPKIQGRDQIFLPKPIWFDSFEGMKRSLPSHGPLSAVFAISLAAAAPTQAITVVLSGTNNVALENWLNANFANITTLHSGNYSNFIGDATQLAQVNSADVVIIGRILSSAEYAFADRAAAFNALTVPLVSFTSYVTRPDGNRLGWESGAVNTTSPLTGAETTLTAAGAAVFGGTAGSTVDWYDGVANLNAAGTGTVGTGEILATINGNILAAHWGPGTTSAGGATFPDDRLLFNLQDASGLVFPNAAGQQALINSLVAYTPLIAVPEPSVTLFSLGALGLLALRRRRG